MLITDFYKILEFNNSDHQISAVIKLNKSHEIYKGHFPGQPVVPGVMQLQIIKELAEKAIACELIMSEVSFAKFLNMVDPTITDEIKIEIELAEVESGQYKINARFLGNEVIFTKLKAKLSAK